MAEQLSLLTPEERRPCAKVLRGKPMGPIGMPGFALKLQGQAPQPALLAEEAKGQACRDRSRRTTLRRSWPPCSVPDCHGQSSERRTFTQSPDGIPLGRRTVSVNLCPEHAGSMDAAQMYELAARKENRDNGDR